MYTKMPNYNFRSRINQALVCIKELNNLQMVVIFKQEK